MTVEDVLITPELRNRPNRAPDFRRECGALLRLSKAMVKPEKRFFQRVVKTALVLCRAGSAGLSVLAEPPFDFFRWEALAGELKNFIGGTTPRSFSPCGTCLDRGEALLYYRPQRFFRYLDKMTPKVIEVLVIPVLSATTSRATLWIVSHDPNRRFDREDLRIMTDLANFAGRVLTQKEAEEKLRQKSAALDRSDSFNRAILSTSPDCVKVLDVAGRVIFINEPGLQLLHAPDPQALLNRLWSRFWSGPGKKAAIKALRSARKFGEGKFQGFRPTLTGEPKWWDVTVNRLPGPEEQFLVVSRDISDLKKKEEVLREAQRQIAELARNLSRKVNERTAELRTVNKKLVFLARKLVESQETERAFIAKELHDEMGQHLTGLKLLLEVLSADLPSSVHARIDRAQQIVRHIMRQIRDLSFDLRQSLPDHISLVAALNCHFQKLQEEHALHVRFTLKDRERLQSISPEHARTVIRLVQEALTNVLRHADTKRAFVHLALSTSKISLQIRDSGRGFNVNARKQSSGLVGMRQRVVLLGGNIEVESRPGAGTQIRVEIPTAARKTP